MKTSMNILGSVLFLAVFFTSLNSTFSQTNPSPQILKRIAETNVAIKVYVGGENGSISLLVYNPHHHSFFYYETPPYSVQWYQDGTLVGERARLENVCGQNFTAVVTNLATGWRTSISYHMGCSTKKMNK